MKTIWPVILFVLFSGANSYAQTPPAQLAVDCVAAGGSGCTSSLRGLLSAPTNPYVTAAGYFSPGDRGGGLFLYGFSCPPQSGTASSITAGTATVPGTFSSSFVGLSVVGSSGYIPPYDIIIAATSSSITLETPPTGSSSVAVPLAISSDNGGTIIADSETFPMCFTRQTSQYGPREWGARQNGNSMLPANDTIRTAKLADCGPTAHRNSGGLNYLAATDLW